LPEISIEDTRDRILSTGNGLQESILAELQHIQRLRIRLFSTHRKEVEIAEETLARLVGRFVEMGSEVAAFEAELSQLRVVETLLDAGTLLEPLSEDDQQRLSAYSSQVTGKQEAIRALLQTLSDIVSARRRQSDMAFSHQVDLLIFVLTIVSIVIALAAYWDARDSARRQAEVLRKQAEILGSSRQALDTALKVANNQLAILEQNLQTAKEELSILREERAQELNRPDVALTPVFPATIAVTLENRSDTKIARDVLYYGAFWNVSRPVGDTFQLVGPKSAKIDYLRPRSTAGPMSLEFTYSGGNTEPIKQGDLLFGYLSVQCPDCSRVRDYWVLFTVGGSGAYFENGPSEPVLDFTHFSKNNFEAALSAFRSHRDLKAMPTR